jgi:cytochrome d ubiquinol oxidase subunit II
MTPMMVFVLLGVGVTAYALTGGADFGGGLWDLLARGPRAEAQRKAIERAIAPIWEVNHIWMIFVIVSLFTVFPDAFAVVSTALHLPLLLALVGIVLRGSAFVFRAYGLQPDATRQRWGRVFAWASALTPVFLGMCLAALSSGEIRVDESGYPTTGFFAGWTSLFAVMVGLFALSLFALLAATYMAAHAARRGEFELRDDFRRRALACEAVAAILAALVLWRAWADSPLLFAGLLQARWSIPVQVLTALVATGAILTLALGRVHVARALVMVQVALVVLGWGLAMDGFLILPDIHIDDAGAEPAVLRTLPFALIGGGLLLAPALIWLFRVFELSPRSSAHEPDPGPDPE